MSLLQLLVFNNDVRPVGFDFFISMDRHVPGDGTCLIFVSCYCLWCMFITLVRHFEVLLFSTDIPVDVSKRQLYCVYVCTQSLLVHDSHL